MTDNTPHQQDLPDEQGKPVDWEARYKGVMRVLNERDEELRVIKGRYAELEKKLQQLLEAQEAERKDAEKLKGEYDLLAQQMEQIRRSSEAHQAEATRWRVIASHPELVPLADLIPPSTDENQLLEVVKKIQGGISTIVEQRIKSAPPGSTPPTQPPRVDELPRDAILDQLNAMAEGRVPFNEEQWRALNEGLTKFLRGG
jgi:hypothetical protein